MPASEIGWRLCPGWVGRGLATEGGRRCRALACGFERFGFTEVVSIYEPDNARSGRVMERLGPRFDSDTVYPELGVLLRVTA